MKKIFTNLLIFFMSGVFVHIDAQTPTLVADLNPGFANAFPDYLTVFNSKLHFEVNGEIYEYDGINNPSKITNFSSAGISSPSNFFVFNNKLYFTAFTTAQGRELYVYDGVSAPSLVIDLVPGAGQGSPMAFCVFQSKLYFIGIGSYLYQYDGTNPPVAINYSGANRTQVYYYSNLVVYNNKLYFGGSTNNNQYELWSYDGVNPPSEVYNINTNTNASSNPKNLAVCNNKLYFSADNGTTGYELWVHDGTNTTLVSDLWAGTSSSDPSNLISYNNQLYFNATKGAGAGGNELYVYTGTGSPSMVADLNISSSSDPQDLIIFDNKLIFGAEGSGVGLELFSYDGSGTPSNIADIWSGQFPGYGATSMAVFNNKLYFCGNNGTSGFELWELASTSTGIFNQVISNIKAYPNPTTDHIILNLDKSYSSISIQIYTSYGNLVDQKIEFNKDLLDIRLEGEPGLYFVKIIADGKEMISKVNKL